MANNKLEGRQLMALKYLANGWNLYKTLDDKYIVGCLGEDSYGKKGFLTILSIRNNDFKRLVSKGIITLSGNKINDSVEYITTKKGLNKAKKLLLN